MLGRWVQNWAVSFLPHFIIQLWELLNIPMFLFFSFHASRFGKNSESEFRGFKTLIRCQSNVTVMSSEATRWQKRTMNPLNHIRNSWLYSPFLCYSPDFCWVHLHEIYYTGNYCLPSAAETENVNCRVLWLSHAVQLGSKSVGGALIL